jgi:CubicO group peptidase (beta-lactamase class C family)
VLASQDAAVADAARYFTSWLGFRQRYDRIPGVQAAVLHDGAIVASCAHGHADVERGVPLTDRHLYRIASHSKTFTATAVMQLAEAGRLRLDDTIGQWLASLAASPIAPVTVRELLAHAGGLVRDGRDGGFWQLASRFPDLDELARIGHDDAAVLARNERFKYSNIGYSLLGQIVERAGGQPYADYVDEHIIEPLGLADTGPELDPGRADEFVTGYSSLALGDRRLPIEPADTRAMASATGFYSTATDVVRYAAAHFPGDDRLLSDDSKRVMQHAHWAVEGAGATSYGLGFAIADIGGRRVLGHGGGFPGQITRTFFDPAAKIAISVLTNAIDGPAWMLAAAGFTLIDLARRGAGVAAAAPSVDLDSFCGRFANVWGAHDVVQLGGRLYGLNPSQPDPTTDAIELEVVDDTTLRIARASGYGAHGEHMTIERAADGSIRSISTSSGPLYPYDAVAATISNRTSISLAQPLRPEPAVG